MQDPDFLVDGVLRGSDFPELAACIGATRSSIGPAVRWKGTELRRGDCLDVEGIIYLVDAGAEVDGDTCLIVSRFALQAQVRTSSSCMCAFGCILLRLDSKSEFVGKNLPAYATS